MRMTEAKAKRGSKKGEKVICPALKEHDAQSATRNSQREAAAHRENASQPMSLRMCLRKPKSRSDSNAPRYQRSRCAHSIRTVGMRSVCAKQLRGAIVS